MKNATFTYPSRTKPTKMNVSLECSRISRVAVIGANGAGKSTILDALTFVLFGKPFRSVNKNQLINSVNHGGTEVEIEFEYKMSL